MEIVHIGAKIGFMVFESFFVMSIVNKLLHLNCKGAMIPCWIYPIKRMFWPREERAAWKSPNALLVAVIDIIRWDLYKFSGSTPPWFDCQL